MKLNTERKVYLGLLTAGLLALGASQFSSGSGTAAVDPASMLVSQSNTTTPVGPITATDPTKAITIAQRLRAFTKTHWPAKGELCADAFQPIEIIQVTAAVPKPTAAEQFRQSHHLDAVVVAGPRSQAIINGQPILLSKEIDGFRLIAVTPRAGIFESPDHTARLQLPLMNPAVATVAE